MQVGVGGEKTKNEKKEDKNKQPVKMESTSTIKTYDEYYTLLEEKNDLIQRVEKVKNYCF